ncbi:MAG: hypothetical protein QOG66_461 [Methylobacteriaceae bacterium]|jgi:hypothetical protein|nr:hypothetical protein [Methylobacteriaceae bacterium]
MLKRADLGALKQAPTAPHSMEKGTQRPAAKLVAKRVSLAKAEA